MGLETKLDTNRVLNGSFGEVWVDNEKLASCKKMNAKLDITKEDVPIPGTLKKGKKMTGYEGKGSLTLYKVSTRLQVKMAENIKNGILPKIQIASELKDPAAYGAERVIIMGVSFDDITLVDWETGKLGEVEMPFTFEDFEYADVIDESKVSVGGNINVGGVNLGGATTL